MGDIEKRARSVLNQLHLLYMEGKLPEDALMLITSINVNLQILAESREAELLNIPRSDHGKEVSLIGLTNAILLAEKMLHDLVTDKGELVKTATYAVEAPTTKPERKFQVFTSYANKDEPLLLELEKHMSSLKRTMPTVIWDRRSITAEMEWEREIDTHLKTADIILLLISADFIASDFCYSVEMEQAMKKHKVGKARVIPIILRPVHLEGLPFGKLKALPTNGKPVSRWPNRDEAFKDVVEGIHRALLKLITGSE